jgi:membrane-bound lytic murein transglycosylase D
MKKLFLLPALILLISAVLQAQGVDSDIYSSYEINWQLDSLIPCYHFKPSDSNLVSRKHLNKFGYAADSMPAYSTDVVAQRLKDIGSKIPMDYNDAVQAYINMYTIRRREQVERMLGLAELYFPIFEEELDRQGMPMELKYLSVVESALNPHARSRVGATGLWQFMLPTGKMYGLDVTTHIDERKDPFKATEAAFRYLRNMYITYQDWLLVIAAYNCGPGNVNKAIARSGGKRNFWEISPYLPQETRGYVPAFIAATYVFTYAGHHNLFPRHVDFTFQQDTLLIHRQELNLHHFAAVTGTDFYTLKDLNPELKLDMVPYSGDPYVLRVPMRTGQIYAAYRDSIQAQLATIAADSMRFAYDTNHVSKLTGQPFVQEDSKPTYPSSGTTTQNGVLVYYKVKSGDAVGKIAAKYHVSPSQIQSWNRLKGYRIQAGQQLKIYVPERYASAYKKEPAKSVATTSETPKNNDSDSKYHVVQSGDTLWDIASSYAVSVEQLKELNSLTSTKLEVGQRIRVR